ncbi:MAG: T9SS type A sorting domain-containing protein, partial [Cyclobacteriaceae bacterium]|nr:T9SS type A sorting domain-containing protein [Cyclobacteriaceae bacterium]
DQKVLRQEKLKIKAPVPRDTTKFWVSLTTKGMAGPNDVTVFVNPRVQPEMYFDNNVLSLFQFLTVQPDRTAPVLDVTVDGRYLTNSDVVSADPRILAKVIDKNPFIMKTDTVGVDLFLRSPCDQEDCPYKRINFSQPEVEWKPATATSDFQVFYHPNQLPPGVYALKANARDGSGNASGELPYEVSFVVSDKTDFAVRSVYPNPSRDVFNFKVFMSGTAAPTDFQLTIYSATGSLVRSFGNEVLESLHIGTNEISLKAVDASGLPLPSGLYVYKMVSALGNKTFTASGRLAVAR